MTVAEKTFAKARFACALAVAVLALVACAAVPMAHADEAAGGVYEIKDNVSGLVEDSQVSQQPYSFSGTTMMPDTYQDIMLVQWSGAFRNLADHPLHAGDYVKVDIDPKLKLYGYLDPSEVKFPDLISTEDGSTVVAESHYDAQEHAVYYVFTDFVDGSDGNTLESLEFETYAVLSLDRTAVPTSGSYTFSNTFGETPLEFSYDVSYASKLPDPILNQAYQKYELTASRVKLDWVNPTTGIYEQSFFVGPVDKGDQTISSRRSADFGFEIFGQTTPDMNADVTVYQVVGAPDSFPENFVIPSSALVDVTDQFTVTRSDTGSLTFAPKSPGATPATSYYYIHVRNGFDTSTNFDSGMTALNYVNGSPVSDMAKVSVGNQFTKDQLAGLARPVYSSVPGKSLTIQKVAEDGSALSGAVFTVLSEDGTQVDRVEVGNDGSAQTKVLPLGTYTVHEEQAPAGYATAADQQVNLSDQENAPIVVTVVDKKLTGTISLRKVDESGSPLAGAVFQILDSEGTVVQTGETGADGAVTFGDLSFGSYALHEVTAPSGYRVLDQNIPVTLDRSSVDVGDVVDAKSENPNDDPGSTEGDNGGGSDGGGNSDGSGGAVPGKDDAGDDASQGADDEAEGESPSSEVSSALPQTLDQPFALAAVGAALLAGGIALLVRLRFWN